ncbi:MAG: esterase-like activity of phytase family protein [Caldilineaceae bacterium]|nr:esterase-like activity of phytase family protein [Caldilineaceae bacterium]
MHHKGTQLVLVAALLTLVFLGLVRGTTQAAPASVAGVAAPAAVQAAISSTLKLVEVGRYSSTLGAEISAYDEMSKRLFVTGDELQIVDLSDPSNPTLVKTLPYAATSVDFYNGLAAVAVPATTVTEPGKVVFLDSDGVELGAFTVGALPDMVTFTPDGKKVLTADEGEPTADAEPAGSISIIDLTHGITTATVTTLGFSAYNSRQADLINQGVRFLTTTTSVAQDLQPEYIAVSPDSRMAWVTLQEANSVAIVDISTTVISKLVPLGLKDHSRGLPSVTSYEWQNRPVLGVTSPTITHTQGQPINLGGFSGLFYEGTTAAGNYRFITHPDRGPNGEPTDIDGDGVLERPFALPNFQPELVRFEFSPVSGQFTITQRLPLFRADGVTPLTGLPNSYTGTTGLKHVDEEPVDLFGNLLPPDPLGADLEGIAVAGDGSFWMVDEYRPAIFHFAPNGVLQERYVPQGIAAAVGQPAGTFGAEVLPEVYAQRRANRGFEAVAIEGDILYAFIQSPLDNPDTTNDASSRAAKNLRIVAFDTVSETVIAEYLYILRDPSASGTARTDKLGDATALGGGRFLVAERDDRTTVAANKLIFEIDLKGATDIHAGAIITAFAAAFPTKTIELATVDELASVNIRPVYKRLVTNVGPLGYTGISKLEGLTFIDENTLAVINDNDFGMLAAPIPGNGELPVNPAPEPILLGLVRFDQPNGLDPSDRDGEANGPAIKIQNWPVLGMFMPDGIAAYSTNNSVYYVTANEGDASDLYGDSQPINALTLDSGVFPNAATLQQNANLGRLKASNVDGDLDGDGDFDRLYVYGGRSFSIWDSHGNLVFDSGEQLEQLTAALTPALFNANDGDPTKVDQRSDDKGPEPEGLTVGVIDGRTYAFVGLERAGGGVVVFDVSNPRQPTFVQYVRSDLDISPEGLKFVPAAKSPIGVPLLIVTNEVSETTTVYAIYGSQIHLPLIQK